MSAFITSLKSYFNSQEDRPHCEIHIKSHTDENARIQLNCCHSIPPVVPVICWNVLVIEREKPPDTPFVQLVSAKRNTVIKDVLAEHGCKNLTALIIIGSVSVIQDLKTFTSPTIPVLIVSSNNIADMREVVKSHSSGQLLFSCVPLSSSEIKQRSNDISVINNSEQSYGQLIAIVRDSVRENVIMSIAISEDKPGIRLIQIILSLRISIEEQGTMEMMYSLENSDHELLMKILMNRSNFRHYFSKDFPAYILFGEWLYSSSTTHRKNCSESYITDLFDAFSSAGIREIVEGLNNFVELPDVGVNGGPVIDDLSSIKTYVADNLIELLKEFLRLYKLSDQTRIHEAFIAISIAIRLFVSCEKMRRIDKIWSENFVEPFNSSVELSESLLPGLLSGIKDMNVILETQPHLMFTWKELFQILSSKIFPLSFIQSLLVLLSEHLIRHNDHHSFIMFFLTPLINHFKMHLKRYSSTKFVRHLNMTHTMAVYQGFDFINFLGLLSEHHKWDFGEFHSVVYDLLDILTDLLNLEEHDAVDCLKKLSANKQVCHVQYFLNQIDVRFKAIGSKLNICHFVELFYAGQFDNQEIIQEYLMNSQSPSSFLESGVISFLEICSERLTANSQKQLSSFLKKICQNYSSQREFFSDLVYLRPIKNASSIINEVLEEILEYHLSKRGDGLRNDLPGIISQVLKYLPIEYSMYHERYVNFLMKIFFRQCDSFKSKYYTCLLKSVCQILKDEDSNSLRASVSFRLLNKIAADMVSIDTESISWLSECGKALSYLANGYVLSKKLQVTDASCSLETKMTCLREAVKNVNNSVNTRSIIYDNLKTFEAHFEDFCSIWQLLFDEKCIELSVVRELIQLYDDCVKEISRLLIRPLIGNSSLYVQTQNVLQSHGIVLPEETRLKINERLILTTGGSKYRSKKNVILCDLQNLQANISDFVSNIESSFEFLVFISHYRGMFLTKPIEYFKARCGYFTTKSCNETSANENDLLVLNHIVELSEKIVFKLMHGESTFSEVETIYSFDSLKDKEKLDNELGIMEEYFVTKLGLHNNLIVAQAKEGLKALVVLFDIKKDMESLFKTCEMYKLKMCLNDEKMKDVQQIVNDLSSKESYGKITLNDGIRRLNLIKENLSISDFEKAIIVFELISVVQHCPRLYNFCVFRGFASVEGYQRFIAEHKLVMIAMEKEDFFEDVLNQLRGAMVFILPFFNQSNNLSQLMTQLLDLTVNIQVGILQLQRVESEIEKIETSFNLIEGETPEFVLTTLKAMLENGAFSLSSGPNQEVVLSLKFYQNSSKNHLLSWNLERLEEFMRKVVFFNAEKKGNTEPDDNEGLIWFMQCYQNAKLLMERYTDLQKMGHRDYTRISDLDKRFSLKDEGRARLDSELVETKRTLGVLVPAINQARSEFKELSFVSLPKMKIISEKIATRNYDLADCVDDIGMHLTLTLDTKVKGILEKNIALFYSNNEHHSQLNHARLTGLYLHQVLSNIPTVHNDLESLSLECEQDWQSQTSSFRMFTAINFNNMELIRLIFWIFGNKFPYHFQLFRCSSSSTKDDLELFFQRINKYPDFKYLIFGVNQLLMEVQQSLINHCSSLRSAVLKGGHGYRMPDLCLVELVASVFQNMPWLSIVKVEKSRIASKENVREYCKANISSRFKCFRVIKGMPGSGKTQFIHKQLQSSFHNETMSISINEAFSKEKCIRELKKLSHSEFNAAVYLNISLFLHKKVRRESKKMFKALAEEINWFFFDYLILGYAEDLKTGFSIRFPDGMSRSLYVEVPFWDIVNISEDKFEIPYEKRCDQELQASYQKFCDVFPVFNFVGGNETIKPNMNIVNDPELSLVFKYLRRYEIGNLDKTINSWDRNPIKIDTDPPVAAEYCNTLLIKYVPEDLRSRKIKENLFLRYLARRCRFMEECPQLMFNSGFKRIDGLDTTHMRSILLNIMLNEVKRFCQQTMQWNDTTSQLIYNFTDGGASFRFISCDPSKLSNQKNTIEQKPIKDREITMAELKAIGVKLPNAFEMNSPKLLHCYLSTALSISLDANDELEALKKAGYILTKDFTLKMLNIHERKECGMPVIIEGDTGVGKTFLIEMLSILWNQSWDQYIVRQKLLLKEKVIKIFMDNKEVQKTPCVRKFLSRLNFNERIPIDDWTEVLSIKYGPKEKHTVHQTLRQDIEFCWNDPILAYLEIPKELQHLTDLGNIIQSYENDKSPKLLASVIVGILSGKPRNCFYKLNVHAATTPEEIVSIFIEIEEHAQAMMAMYKDNQVHPGKGLKAFQRPIISVFLDEINTSSCSGFLKEIIIDRTMNGVPISDNIFIVAACNPYRGVSQISASVTEGGWLRPAYYVQPLAPTLELIKWNYGSLRDVDEAEYIREKMQLLYSNATGIHMLAPRENAELQFLSGLIQKGQMLIRKYATEQLLTCSAGKMNKEEAVLFSKSCVSQRDMQRVFIIYEWLLKWFKASNHYSTEPEFNHRVRATYVAVGVAYYFRLNAKYRQYFEEEMNLIKTIGEQDIPIRFSVALQQELDLMLKKFKLPARISATLALKENVYATVVCLLNRIPLIIVGPPGSSKTLTIKIICSNLKGINSEVDAFKNESLFPPVEMHSYQCTRRSTSSEIELVFQRAINRKKMLDEVGLKNCSFIVMDEAGLTEESHESLKVLHYYLDKNEVSFVGLSNHMLDAAKTNRAICLYHTNSSLEDLRCIARTMFSPVPISLEQSLSARQQPLPPLIAFIDHFLDVYMNKMKEFKLFYGVRDFVHFLLYLYRNKELDSAISPKVVVEALERNFNGKENVLDVLIPKVLTRMDVDPSTVTQRTTLDVFKSSLEDQPSGFSIESQVRYKLVIDENEDDSLVEILLAFGILDRAATSILTCTNFPGDTESVKTNTIAAVRYCAAHGKTAVLINCEDIEESFYDLFNQNFSSIDRGEGNMRLYANIAVGAQTKLCFVDPKFQCVVIVKKKQLHHTPSPYLDRFEKYWFTPKSILTEYVQSFPKRFSNFVTKVVEKVNKVISNCRQYLYSFTEDTVSSLMLSFLKPVCRAEYSFQDNFTSTKADSVLTCIVKALINFAKKLTPLCFPQTIDDRSLDDDVRYINKLICESEKYIPVLKKTKSQYASSIAEKTLEWLMEENGDTCDDQIALGVFCFEQWLEISLCKKLMCMMTPEALIALDCNLPLYYKEFYLKNQFHFSLAGFMNHIRQTSSNQDCSISALENTQSATTLPNIKKAVCYTRSTHLIHELLPLHYNYWRDNLPKEEREKLEAFFNMEIELINIYSLNTTSTSQNVQSVLKHFLSDEKHEVLLLIADMKTTSSEVINHTRIMITELESQSAQSHIDKLIVFLLHFPSDLQTNRSYPAIFLHNWDHYYLDNIGARVISGRGNIDIVSWLKQCCCLTQSDPFVTRETLCHWLNEILPSLSAHFSIKDVTDLSRCVDIWKNVLFETKLADELIVRFLSYWTPTTMIDVSRKALMGSKTSSLGLISIIESEFHQSFTDFMLYSLSLVNKHGGVRLLSSNELKNSNLFLRLLPSVPLPLKMEDFRAVYTILHLKRHKLHSKQFCFPFFKLIFRSIEHVLNVTLNEFYDSINTNLEVHQQEAAVNEVELAFEQPRMMSNIVNLMKISLQTQVQHIVYLREALNAMKEDTAVLKAYIQDAVSKQMNKRGSIGTSLLHDYFTKMISDSDDTESQLCAFHVNLRFHIKTSTIWSALFIIHCIDDLLEAKLCEEALLIELFPYQNLENVTIVFSNLIEVIYSVVCNILKSEDYSKISSISSIFFKTVSASSHADLKQISCHVINHWILVYVCMELRHACITFYGKEEVLTSFEDSALKLLELLSNEPDKGRTLNLKSVIESLMSQVYNVNMDVAKSFPTSAIHMVDSILSFYVIRSKMLFLKDDDFDWFLKLIDTCRDSALHHVLVYYLKLILLIRESGNDCEIQAALNFNNNYRKRIGTFLTHQSAASTYIPKFYKKCPNLVVKHPSIKKSQSILGDSYFQIVVEHLSQSIDSSHSSDFISLINKDAETTMDSSVDDREKILIAIEKEAIVYVLIMYLARNLKDGGEIALAEIGSDIKSINSILNCEHFQIRACSNIEGHGISFALRLFQAFNSTRKFGHMMTNNFELFFEPFECLRSVPKHIRLPKTTSSLEELPIMSCIREYYKDLCRQIQLGIEKILHLQVDEGVSQILRVGSECYMAGVNLEEEKKLKWTYNMILLLVVYNLCFRKENRSRLLAIKIHKDFEYIEKDFRNLIIFFANPDYFRKNCCEVTNNYEDLERILLNEIKLPMMDILIQSLAVVVGFPKKNSHFWAHLCCPGEMCGSFVPPTLQCEIHPDKHQFYPEVHDLMSFKHLEYIKRNSLNFQSLSFIRFINYGVMLFSSLVNPAVGVSSHEVITPDGMSISTFCNENLKRLWEKDLSTVLNVSDDDKEVLIVRFLIQFYKSSRNGNFLEKDVVSYEKEIHSVFVEAWTMMKNIKRSQDLKQNLAVTFRSLESEVLPVFFSRDRTKSLFIQTILSSTDFGNTKSKLYVLYQFILWRNSINAGGKLLPYLIYCYHFITDKWSHMILEDRARKQSLNELLKDYLKENLPDSKDDVMKQFDLMKTHYNTYSAVTGAKPLPSNVWDYLSFGSTKGVLLEAIYRIVNKYNDFLMGVMKYGSCLPSLSFLEHHSDCLPVSVIDATTCCFGDSTRFDDCQDFYVLIEKHCNFTVCPPKDIDPTFLPQYSTEYFDFEKIQLGIVKKFIMHKQLISLDGVTKEFRFLNNVSQELKFTKYNTSLLNTDFMQQSLQNHSDYLINLPHEKVLEFKQLFFPLHYHAMLKVLIGLAVLVKCLSQVLTDQKNDENIAALCVSEFISFHLNKTEDDQNAHLEIVGIHKQTAMYYYSGIIEEQYVYLSRLNMRYVFDVVKRLSAWIQSGVYDFYSLPTSLKTELDKEVCDEIRSTLQQSKDVQSVVQALVDMVISCECAVKEEMYKNTQSPLCEVIDKKCNLKSRNPLVLSALHKSVQVQHYVYFLLELRSILVKCTPTHLPVEHDEPLATTYNPDIPASPPPSPLAAVKPPLVKKSPVQALTTPSDQVKMKEAAAKLSMTDLLDFLKSNGMTENVIEFLQENEYISAEVLFLAMNEDNQLAQIGMERPYLRLKFKVLFRRFLLKRSSNCTVDMIANFCLKFPMLAKFSKVFEEHQIDGEMFSMASNEELTDLGICGIEKTILRVNFNKEFDGDNL